MNNPCMLCTQVTPTYTVINGSVVCMDCVNQILVLFGGKDDDEWQDAPDCNKPHAYGEEGWRPGAEGHEHLVTEDECNTCGGTGNVNKSNLPNETRWAHCEACGGTGDRPAVTDAEPTGPMVEAFIKAATQGWEQPYHGYNHTAVFRGLRAALEAAPTAEESYE